MYSILDVKRPTGRTAAVIESFNNERRVSYAESEHLGKALEQMLNHGLNVIIPRGNEQIEINTAPENVNFLEELGRYLQLSFDFLCSYTKTDRLPQQIIPLVVSIDSMQREDFQEEWLGPATVSKEQTQFILDSGFLIMSVQYNPNWVVE